MKKELNVALLQNQSWKLNPNRLKYIIIKKLVFLFAIFVIVLNTNAQEHFIKKFDQFERGSRFVKTSDNGFIISTSYGNSIIKIDKFGNLKWSKNFSSITSPFFIHELPDSTIIIAYNNDFANSKYKVVKFDSNGNFLTGNDYFLSEGYPVFRCHGTFLRNDTLVAIVSERDSVFKAYQISTITGDTIGSKVLIDNGKRISALRYLNNRREPNVEHVLFTNWQESGTSVVENFIVLYYISEDLIVLDSTVLNLTPSLSFSSINSNNNFISYNASFMQFYNLQQGNVYLDTSYTSSDLGLHFLFNHIGSYYEDFLVSGRLTLTQQDNIRKAMLSKVDENGNFLFRKQYTLDNHGQAYFMYADYGDDYILAVGGISESATSGVATHKLFVVKTDLDGNLTSIPNYHKEVNLKVYPNPAQDFFRVDFPTDLDKNTFYEIYDLQGRLLISGKLQNDIIEVSELSSGMYILNVQNSKFRRSVKWIKD